MQIPPEGRIELNTFLKPMSEVEALRPRYAP
jgi:hypothetical protein